MKMLLISSSLYYYFIILSVDCVNLIQSHMVLMYSHCISFSPQRPLKTSLYSLISADKNLHWMSKEREGVTDECGEHESFSMVMF